MIRIFPASLLALSLAACGGSDPAGKSTTKLDAVEVQPGSVSDSMIILDDASIDGTAVDNSIPDDSTKKKAANEDAEDAAEPEGDTENTEAVPAPAAKQAVTADTATKKGE